MSDKPETKKPETKTGKTPSDKTNTGIHAPPKSDKKGGPQSVAGNCNSWGCKAASKRFDFCDEHYDQFKFGLVKKSGEPVSDYEKKFGHYQAHLKRLKATKTPKVA